MGIFWRDAMADPCAPRGPGRLIGVIFCLLMVLILAREIGALMGARVELPGTTENPAWTSIAAIRENAVGTVRDLPVVHERAPGEGLGEQSPAEAPVDARPETKRPPYGVNESVRLEEVDESCHGEASLDIDGPAVTWGLDHKVSSAQECCDRCKAQGRGAREKGEGARACNSWVFCPLPECWAPDIWNHTLGECWLKTQEDARKPRINFRGAYPPAFRREHSTSPAHVPWQAGVLLD